MTSSLPIVASILCHVVSNLADKKLTSLPREQNMFSFAMIEMKANLIVFLPLLTLFWHQMESDLLMASAVLGFFYGVASEFSYRGLRQAQASMYFPFVLSTVVASVYLGSLYLFHEILKLNRLMGVVGVIAGNVLLLRAGRMQSLASSPEPTSVTTGGLTYFFGTAAALTCYQLFSKYFSLSVTDGLAVTGFMYIFVVITLLLINSRHLIADRQEYLDT